MIGHYFLIMLVTGTIKERFTSGNQALVGYRGLDL
jgi:hypothetical protein